MPHSKKSSKEIKRDTSGLQAIRRGAQPRVAFKEKRAERAKGWRIYG